MYKPELLTQNFDNFLREYQENEKKAAISVDVSKLSSKADRDQKNKYLEEVKVEY